MAKLNVVIVFGPFGEDLTDTGHMFIEIQEQAGQDDKSYGNQPGGLNLDDDETETYAKRRDHVTTFEITDRQAQSIRDWVEADPSRFDWSLFGYNCIDFVYDALKVANLPIDDTDMDLWPGNNVDEIEEAKLRWELRNQYRDEFDTFRMLSDPAFWDLVQEHGENLFDQLPKLLNVLKELWEDPLFQKPHPELNDLYNSARAWTLPRRDPLALDLDGDGIEATGINSNLLFDHDGDGHKNATGWIKGDDALLVWDRNGNGLIDSGAELFGVDFVKGDGQKASDGFDALRDLDSNRDGQFNAQDARFTELRLWRDLNQDGISQSNELSSLSETGIVSIDLNPTLKTLNLGNGNQQTAESTYTRSDGSQAKVANLNFVNNPFYRQFADRLDTSGVAALPDMQGSGAIREAA